MSKPFRQFWERMKIEELALWARAAAAVATPISQTATTASAAHAHESWSIATTIFTTFVKTIWAFLRDDEDWRIGILGLNSSSSHPNISNWIAVPCNYTAEGLCQICIALQNAADYCQILQNNVRYCEMLLHSPVKDSAVNYCTIALQLHCRRPFQMCTALQNTVDHYQIQQNNVKYSEMLQHSAVKDSAV